MKVVFDRLLGRTDMEPKVVLLKEREPARLGDVQRRIRIFLQAMWGCDFVLKLVEGDHKNHENLQPFVKDFTIHLPEFFYDFTLNGSAHITGLETYRAATAHATAHLIYSREPFSAVSLSQLEKALISLIEDARVEALAIRQFPGLKQLWIRQHQAIPLRGESAGDYISRFSRALLDETFQDDDPWVCQGRELFNAPGNLENDDISRNIGLTLAKSFRQKKIRFNARTDRQRAPYRDDNRYLWDATRLDAAEEQELPVELAKFKLLLENNTAVGSEEDVKEPPRQLPIQAALASETFVYSEWDYRGQVMTPAWVTLRERSPASGDLKIVGDIVSANHHLLSHMKNILQAILYKGVHRIRKLENGDEIDINAAIRAQTEIRQGLPPDLRIMMRTIRKTRDISALVLLDLSYSTNQKIQRQEHTVLQLTQQVCVLFAEAIETIGDPLAIHGFNSRGRHDVDYYRFKDFDQPYDDTSKAKIAGMTGNRSTRIGAAIRHATYYLNQQKSGKKLLMVITDGEPYDIDRPDPRYLCFDAKLAVGEAARGGIHTYCISLDPDADEYVNRIFGARNYFVVDHVRSLPEKMLTIYAALTR